MTGERTTQEQRSGDGMTAKEDIRHIFLEQMEQLAYSYTPEWKFDAEHPDVGSVLLSIYSDLLSKMMQSYQQAPERAKAEFMSVLGTRTKPAEAAKGYLSIESMQGVTDTYVLPSGMGLIAKQETQEDIKWMTQKELCVSAAEMKTIYYTDGIRDAIYCVAQKQGPLTPSLRQNLQEHVCCLGHSVILAVTGEAEIWIRFFPENQWKDWDRLIRDREKTMFTYLSREGEVRFREWTCDHHIIRLKKTKEMPDFQTESHNDKTGGWLCWYAKDIQSYSDFEIVDLRLGAVSEREKPEYMYSAEGEECFGSGYPFGERPYVYGESYLVSDAMLGKRGANIHIRIQVAFRRIALLTETVPMPVHWKAIMKESDFPKEEEMPITIEEVVWEYYNGTGFTKLCSTSQYSQIFTPSSEAGDKQETYPERVWDMEFICPSDIQPFLVNAKEAYCIRTRIVRMQNVYARTGYYVTPYISHMDIAYDYRDRLEQPEACELRNNAQRVWVDAFQMQPFQKLTDRYPSFYIGFSQKLTGGPFGMYCRIRDGSEQDNVTWMYEYAAAKGWKSLIVEDETDNLKKSGMLTVFCNEDSSRQTIFGTEGYWFRIRMVAEGEKTTRIQEYPIQELWWNSVPVLAVERMPDEYFTLGGYAKENIYQLSRKNIQQIAVWVKERRMGGFEVTADGTERTPADRKDRWVKWNETEELRNRQPEERIYQIDRQEGRLRFPNGIERCDWIETGYDNVKVVYTWGGGRNGNLPTGQRFQPEYSIRSLGKISNHVPLTGGREAESMEEAWNRTRCCLRHRNRAVMLSDYEALAKEASREVVRVKVCTNRRPDGKPERGALTMVILQERFHTPSFDFQSLKETIETYIRSRMSGIWQLKHQFYIIEPWYTEIQVSAVCILKPQVSLFVCQAEVQQKLEEFLNPLTGNFDGSGWKIGSVPHVEQIRNAIRKVNGIESIKKLLVKAYCKRGHKIQEIDLEGDLPEYLVIVNGTHHIRLSYT